MRNSFDYYKQIEKPNMYLCNPNQEPIGAINSENRHLTLRFNDLSELTFTVPKIKGSDRVYDRIETRRLIFVEKIGWFQITDVVDNVDGNYESKDVTCESHQTQLKTRGFVTEERVYMFYNPNDPLDNLYDSANTAAMPSVVGQLYRQLGIKVNLAIGDIEPDHDYKEWTLIYIEDGLKFKSKSYGEMYTAADTDDNICRTFSDETTYGYDFIVNNVEQAFEVVFDFDFLYHTIKVKSLENITKHTNIYISLDNVAESISVTENAENIVTVLSCNGNDLDITTVNPMGTNYIVNFDYYKKKTNNDGTVKFPWMSEKLIDALDEWQEVWEENQDSYKKLVSNLQKQYLNQTDITKDIEFANLKLLDLQTARDQYTAKENDGSGIIDVENVDIGNKSMCATSTYQNNAFDENKTIRAFQKPPKVEKNSADKYTFFLSGAFREDTVSSMLKGFISNENKADDGDWEAGESSEAFLYFSDDSTKTSYCKLRIAAEVGVVKDASNNIVENGTVTVRGVTLKVRTTTSAFYVTPAGSSEITVSKSNPYFIYNGNRYKITQSADDITSVYCFYVSGFKRYSTYQSLVGADNWFDIWSNKVVTLKATEDNNQKEIDELTTEMESISETCNIQQYIKSKSDDLYNEFANYWIEGEYSNDSIAALDTTTMDERIELAQELMNAGFVELAKVSQPTFELSVSAINFIKLIEFRSFTDQLELGRVITVERDDNTHYRPALTSIEYNLDEVDTFNLTFSTAGKLDETEMTFADLLNESSSTSRTISANWSNLTDYWKNKDKITSLINAPLDRTLRAAQANMVNQEFAIDATGILGRKWSDDSHTSFEEEQVRIVNNTILFTDDNWETAKTALGKVYFDHYDADGNKTESVGYGLLAEVLVGSLIMGEELQVRNSNNSILLDENGITIKDIKNVSVFQASTTGDVYIKGQIHATSLTLDSGVKINFSKISNVPDFATNDKLSASMASLTQTFEAENGKLKSEISETYATKNEVTEATGELEGQITSATTTLRSEIQQTANSITLSVSETYATKNEVTEVAGELALYVKCDENDQIVSMLNAAANVINIKSNRLTIESDKFTLSADGTIKATAGYIGSFEITSDGLESPHIKLNSQSIYFPTQSTFNLANDVTIFNEDTVSYIATTGVRDFEIRNIGGAGIRFKANSENQTVKQTITINNVTLTNETVYVDGYESGVKVSASLQYSISNGGTLLNPLTYTIYIRGTRQQYSWFNWKDESTNNYTCTFVIPAGSNSGTISIEQLAFLSIVGGNRRMVYVGISSVENGTYSSSISYSNVNISATNNVLYSLGSFFPNKTATSSSGYLLGDDSHVWRSVRAYTASITTSDRREKNNIRILENEHEKFFDKLQPVTYVYEHADSGRTHLGFIAQDVEKALVNAGLTTMEFAGLCIGNDENKTYGLRYEEFIALNTHEIQKLKRRVKELENTIKELKGD